MILARQLTIQPDGSMLCGSGYYIYSLYYRVCPQYGHRGVIEATNPADEMYQTERLLEVIERADSGISPQRMVDLTVGDVTEFVGDVEPADDMTVVVIRCVE